MRSLRIRLFVLLVFYAFAGNSSAMDLQEGMFDIEWGTSVANTEGLYPLWSSGEADFYVKPHEVYTINDIKVSEVIYGFYARQFFAVYIKIDTLDVFESFRSYMNTKYGNPKETLYFKNDLTVYRWKYKGTKIKLKLSGKDHTMKLAFYHTPLSARMNENQQDQFQSKSYGLFPLEKDKTPDLMPLLKF